ncbi:MAG: hypothetical protein P0Y49_09730 [Candidatus Pedobacter colombiensis]|uniref:Fibronectin type III domain-containing protein n=1 Tax=Candidatus Pedobacter colombiensis TaxID=3121371 RepID=A0AAJ5WF52_9SPHI|nr:hypothetical protein [Pedobacter sp.]WEK21417.1 MAG: hypothetical protein P0Y49_09730 [Pedobacter sp.]
MKLMNLILVSCFVISSSFGQNPKAVPGRAGIWIICGDKLPKGSGYKIMRQKGNAGWIDLAELRMPATVEQVRAELLNVQRIAGLDLAPISQVKLDSLWQRINARTNEFSPPEIQGDYALRSAIGTAWYDATADSLTSYNYKVQLLQKNAPPTEGQITGFTTYPGEKFSTDIKPVLINPSKEGIYAEFEVVDQGKMTHCKVFRGYYMRSGYQEINVSPMFISRNNKLFISFTDKTAVEKVPYTYVLMPFDAVGNTGLQSPEIRAFNVPEKSIVPSVTNFKAISAEKEKAIKLSWKLPATQNITSVDIYKSRTFDGKYQKIASLGSSDSLYLDHLVDPITTYYYTIGLNGVYESSPLSPRVPGVLKASNENRFPPQNLQLRQNGQEVILTFSRMEPDTRAYHIYRARGREGIFEQLGLPIITDSSRIAFIDTIPATATSEVYAYAVADQNTSYVISPRTEAVYAYTSGSAKLPIPHDVYVRKTDDQKLQVIWPDMRRESATIQGYLLYRHVEPLDSTAKGTAAVLLSQSVIPATVNCYTDSLIEEGNRYFYSIKTVGETLKNSSSPSLEAGYTLYADIPGGLANVKAFGTGDAVELHWDNPMGQELRAIKIFRAEEGKPAVEIASLPANKEAFTDKTVKTGNVYYYSFKVQNSKGKTSMPTTPIGIRL